MTKAPKPPTPRRRLPAWGWWLVALGALGLLSSGVAWALTTSHPLTGGPLVEAPFLGVLASALLGLIGVILPKLIDVDKATAATAEHAAATAEHVVNTHDTILRDDIDQILTAVQAVRVEQAAQKVQLSALATRTTETARDVAGLREDIGLLRKAERQQWEAIEDTAQKARKLPRREDTP